MQDYKRCIFIVAIIAIILQSSVLASLQCSSDSGVVSCPESVTKCFISRASDGRLTRGCADNLCQPPVCLTCGENNCNSALMCRQCDESDPKCSTTEATDDKYNHLCNPNELCLVELSANGKVKRGCGVACGTGKTNCQTCKKDNCNEGIYPAERKLCHQCSGATCNNVNDNIASPCEVYKNDQKCYTIGSDDKTMQRGCTTDANAKCPWPSTNTNCAFCDHNGCNNRIFESVLGSCIKCSDAETCPQSQQADKAKDCTANYTQTEDSCYHQLKANGIVSRGCINELKDTKCLEEENCVECKGTACNVAAATFSCLNCRSDSTASCRQAEVEPTKCNITSLSDLASMQCYSAEWDGVVIRGCLNDLESPKKNKCLNTADDSCTICNEPNCNILKYNGAGTLQHMGLGLLGLIFLVRHAL
ncbi:uncharacterized protein LOC117780837 [Drosophila innubila]|uniref:uncharacterized protein LOC117780837 n=1 Tax=Drosophila innubila TaxID=198719 RepID=UPI00148E53A7|nr:uncharacterized protein LOC117780837 [Drosophila innubila]